MTEEKKLCELCQNETRALRKCKECSIIFCGDCMRDFHDTGGEIVEVYPLCPKCKSANLVDVSF
jgi:hypothetical protein